MNEEITPNLPLRNLILTILRDRDPETRLLSDEKVEAMEQGEYDGGFERYIPNSAGLLADYGIRSYDVNHRLDDGDEYDAYIQSYMFVRGREVVLVEIDCPGPNDDEGNGSLASISDVLTLEQAQEALERRMSEYQRSVETQHQSVREACGAALKEMQAEPQPA